MTANNNVTVTESCMNIKCNNKMMAEEEFSPKILKCFQHLASTRGISTYDLLIQSFSDLGENSFGQIFHVTVIDVNHNNNNSNNNNNNNHNNDNNNNNNKTKNSKMRNHNEIEAKADFSCIVKISPKNPKRRLFMRVVDYYAKEVFTYSNVFQEYYTLYEERFRELNQIAATTTTTTKITQSFDIPFNVVPQMYYSCLDVNDEFLILEDLSQYGFKMNSRMHTPNYDLVIEAFRAIAHLHAMSFALQVRKPQIFTKLLPNLNEQLFTETMPALTEQFAKRYLRRARLLFEQCYECPMHHSELHIKILEYMEMNFKRILVDCIKPDKAIPYAVISHGDFWNNNILYKYDDDDKPISAKLIDFQICRYNAPVLDLVHYLYTCTEKELRDKHFWDFMDCYYMNLEKHLQYYDLSIDIIYPRHIFLQQLNNYGIYGFCMAVFSLPFFISTKKEILDFDEVAEAIETNTSTRSSSSSSTSSSSSASATSCPSYSTPPSSASTSSTPISSTSSSFGCLEMNNSFATTTIDAAANDDDITIKLQLEEAEKYSELWKEYDMLNERTIPIFKKRILGILEDIIQYQMIDNILDL